MHLLPQGGQGQSLTVDHVHAFVDDALGNADATGVAARIVSGEVSAREVTEAAIARAKTVNPALNGIQLENFEQARADSEHPAGGVFSGVPTFVKDNTDVAGLPTNHGSLAVNGRPARDHAPFTKQFLSTGMTVLGKTTMPEFGFNATTEYENLPPTRNPWNTGYSSGASSGGSAVMVASGVVPIAHANDGGGSIRIPAAACGLVGLKPSRGRVVDAAEAAHMPVNIVVNGVLTRSVRDTAHFFAGVEKHFRNPSFERLGLIEGPGSRRLKIGLVVDSITGEPTDLETRNAVLDTAKRLEALGHTLDEVPPLVGTKFIKDFVNYWAMLAFSTQHFGTLVMGPGFDRRHTDNLTRGLAKHFARNIYKTPLMIRGLKKTEQTYADFFTSHDLVLSPVLAHTTPKLGYISPDNDYATMIARLIRYVSFTPLNNASGGPAISLPVATSSEGLPIGVHFSAAHGDERTLLEIGYELEADGPFARIQD